jgi:glycosyltransferase involved in cell wall biosynthesis
VFSLAEVVVNTGRGSATETRLRNIFDDSTSFHYAEDHETRLDGVFFLDYVANAFSLYRDLRSSEIDDNIVLSKANLTNLFLSFLLKFSSAKVILDNDDYEPAISKEYYEAGDQGLISHLLTYPAFYITPFLCDHMVVVSVYLEEKFSSLGYPEERISLIRNGADAEFFSDYSEQKVDEIRKSNGLEGYSIIGYLGTLKPQSSIDKFFPIFKELAEENSEVRLMIVGGGPEKGRLEEMTRELGIDDKVIFTGMVDHSDVPEYLQVFDLAILPLEDNNHNRGRCSVKMFEYMAAGLPIIADAVGEVNNVLSEEFRVYSEEDWKATLGELFNHGNFEGDYDDADYSWCHRKNCYNKVLRNE